MANPFSRLTRVGADWIEVSGWGSEYHRDAGKPCERFLVHVPHISSVGTYEGHTTIIYRPSVQIWVAESYDEVMALLEIKEQVYG